MPCVNEIFGFINTLAPFSTQESWDNSGFLVGDGSAQVETAALVLDITLETIEQAKRLGAQLIISHHPVIFNPLKELHKGDAAYELITSGISAICAHTCLDAASGGVNDVLAAKIGLNGVVPLLLNSGESTIVRLGQTEKPLTAAELGELVSKALGCQIRMADGFDAIKTVAICGGAGGSFIEELAGRADAYVTGELSHHHFIFAKEHGMTAVAAGHFETENPVLPALRDRLGAEFEKTNFVLISQKNPIIYM